MKKAIITLAIAFAAIVGMAQIQWIKTSTYYGVPDSGAIAGNKINTNFMYLNNVVSNYISTNVPGSGGGSSPAVGTLWFYNVTQTKIYPSGNYGTNDGWINTNGTKIHPL